MLGSSWGERLLSRQSEELGDTIADQVVVISFARLHGFAAAEARALAPLQKTLAAAEHLLASGSWPDRFGVADASVISGVGYLVYRQGATHLEPYPSVRALVERHAERPIVRDMIPRA